MKKYISVYLVTVDSFSFTPSLTDSMFEDEPHPNVNESALGEVSTGLHVVDDFYSIVKPKLDYDGDGLITISDIESFCKVSLPKVKQDDIIEVLHFYFNFLMLLYVPFFFYIFPIDVSRNRSRSRWGLK